MRKDSASPLCGINRFPGYLSRFYFSAQLIVSVTILLISNTASGSFLCRPYEPFQTNPCSGLANTEKDSETPETETRSEGDSVEESPSTTTTDSWHIILGVGAAGILAIAAGGSGGSSDSESAPPSSPPPAPPVTPPDTGITILPNPKSPEHFNTPEYRARADLEILNAKEAYSNISAIAGAGQAGEGITIAILDTGVHVTHSDLDESIDEPGCLDTPSCSALYGDNDPNSHGTHVAGIAAADKDGQGIHGVAFNAGILAGCAFITGGCSTFYSSTATLLKWAAQEGATVANMSYGFTINDESRSKVASDISGFSTGNMVNYNALPLKSYLFNAPSSATSSDYQRAAYALKQGLVGVVAAGNYHSLNAQSNPEILQATVTAMAPLIYSGTSLEADLNRQWIAAINLTSNNLLSSSSHACGDSAPFCLAAPGTGIYSTVPGGYAYKSGTSMAAPQISGAIAVVSSAFPTLELPAGDSYAYLCSSTDSRRNTKQCHSKAVVNRLFVTARDLGAPGTDSIYGQGLVDLESATQLIGTPQLQTNNGQSITIDGNGLELSPPIGDGVKQQLGSIHFLALDSYDNAGFMFNGEILLNSRRYSSVEKIDSNRYFNNSANIHKSSVQLTKHVSFDVVSTHEQKIAKSVLEYSIDHLGTLSFKNGFNAAKGFGVLADSGINIHSLTSTQAFSNPFQSFNNSARGISYELALSENIRLKTGLFQGNAPVYDQNNERKNNSIAVELNSSISQNLHAGLTFGRLDERNTLLGTYSGGFDSIRRGSQTAFSGVHLKYFFEDKTTFLLNYNHGTSQSSDTSTNKNAIFRITDEVNSDNFSAGIINRFDKETTLAFFVTQPLAVTNGDAILELPTNYEGSKLTYQTFNIDLSPKHKQMDYELVFKRHFPDINAVGKVNILRIENYNNISNNDDTLLIFSMDLRF